jgi:hypothetical protein
MGRNATPKIGEWRDGARYDVTERNGMTVATRTTVRMEAGIRVEHEEILCCFYNDSFAEAVFASFNSGFNRGKVAGIAEAQATFRQAMGLN